MFRESKQLIANAGTDKPKAKKDERFYEVKTKDGVANSKIRFLPSSAKDSEKLVPTFFIQYYFHAINNNGQFMYEECPTSIGEKCPICEYNYKNWKNYTTRDEKSRSRKQKFISNIYVVKDIENPDRNNKVYLYRFGKTVYDKIMGQIRPKSDQIETKEPYDIVNIMTGKDFIIRVKTLKTAEATYPNYDDSKFAEPSSLCGGVKEEIDKVAEQIFSLEEFVLSKEKLRPYSEIKTRFESFISSPDSDFDKNNTGVSSLVEADFPKEKPLEQPKVEQVLEEKIPEKKAEPTKIPESKKIPDDDFFG